MSSLFASPSPCVCDAEDKMHHLELTSANDILLDGQLAAVVLLTEETLCLSCAGKTYTFSLADFWHACAGGEPTATDAGFYLAASVAAKHYHAQVQQLLALEYPISRKSLVPSFRLDSCVENVLRGGYDGTREATQTIARILGKNAAQIESLAHRAGLAKEAESFTDTQVCPVREDHLPPETSDSDSKEREMLRVEEMASSMAPPEVSPYRTPGQPMLPSTDEEKRPYTWTDEQTKLLRAAFAADKTSPVLVIAKRLAAEHGWPEKPTASKAYSLGFAKPENRPSVETEAATDAQQVAITGEDSPHSEHRKQEEIPVNVDEQPSHTSPAALPSFYWVPQYTRTLINDYYALDAAIRRDRHEAATQIAHQRRWPVSDTEEKIGELELEEKRLLSSGNQRWSVKVGGISTSWNLDYVYGKFPLAPGERFTFEHEDYLLRRVYSNMLIVERVANAMNTNPGHVQPIVANIAS